MNRIFKLEVEMRPLVADFLRDMGQSVTVWREQPVHSGYADLVAVIWHQDRCLMRKEKGPVSSFGAGRKCGLRLLSDLPPWYPLFKEVIAVELKLSNWPEAFGQACSYSYGATLTYVALPQNRLCRDSELDKIAKDCERKGVGLLSVNKEGVTGLIRPRRGDYILPQEVVRISEIGWQKWRKSVNG